MPADGVFIPFVADAKQARDELRRFVADAKVAAEKASADFSRALTEGLDLKTTSRDFIAQLREINRAQIGQAKEALRRGLIDRSAFTALKREADAAFNASILPALQRMREAGQENTAEFRRLQNALKNVAAEGRRAGTETERGLGGLVATVGRLRLAFVGLLATLGIGRAIRRGINFLRSTIDVAEALAKSYLQLSTAAKLFGVSQQALVELASTARTEYRLNATAANDLAIQVTKLAARAGEAARSQEILAAALDLGAAQGLSAQQVGIALEQTLRGLDEGTDKLFQKNPSQIYAEYAASIGKTAGRLSDVEQKQALVNAVLTEGAKVQGAYGEILATNVGKLTTWRQRVQEAREEIGRHVMPVVTRLTTALSPVLADAVTAVTRVLEFFMRPLDRVILRMERLGQASELALPLILADRIATSRGAIEDLRDELRRLQIEFGRIGARPGGPTAGGGAVGPPLPATVVDLRREQERRQRELNDALLAGDVERTEEAQKRLLIIQRALEIQQQLRAEERAIRTAEAAIPEAQKKADLAAELAEIEIQIETMLAQIEERGESVAIGAVLARLEARRDEMMKELGRLEDTVETGTTNIVDTAGAGATSAIDTARERLEEAVRVFNEQRAFAERAGVQADALPESVVARLREVVQLQEQIRKVEEDSALLGGNVPPGTTEFLDHLRERLAALQQSLTGLIDASAAVAGIGRLADSIVEPVLAIRPAVDAATAALTTLQLRLADVKQAEAELTQARLIGDPERVAAAEENAARAKERLREAARRLATALGSANLPANRFRAIIDTVTAALREAGIELDDTTEKTGGLASKLQTLEDLARGVLSVAEAVGAIDEESRRALEGVISLISGFRQLSELQAGLSAGTIGGTQAILAGLGAFGAIAGGVVAIASLLGDSPEDQQRRKILEDNTAALDRLTRGIADLSGLLGVPGEKIVGVREAVGATLSADRSIADELRFRDDATPFLRRELHKLGLTMEDAERIAAEFGITLDGSVESIEALNEALAGLTVDDLFTTFRSQMDLLEDEVAVFGLDATAKLRRQREIFLAHVDLPEDEEERLRGIDLSTPQGRAEWVAAMQDLFERFLAGEITLGDLGGLSPDDFREFIRGQIEAGEQGATGDDQNVGFQVRREITEVTGTRLVGLLNTIAYWAERIAQGVWALVTGRRDVAPPNSDGVTVPGAPPDMSGAFARMIHYEMRTAENTAALVVAWNARDVRVHVPSPVAAGFVPPAAALGVAGALPPIIIEQIGPFEFAGGADRESAREFGQVAGDELVRVVNRGLRDERIRAVRSVGGRVR